MSHFKAKSKSKKSGDWYVYDAISGIRYFGSEMTMDYKGRIVKRGTEDPQHPQELPMPVIREVQPPFVSPMPTEIYTDVSANPYQDDIDDFYDDNIASTQSSGNV